jgi:hypothetical protein
MGRCGFCLLTLLSVGAPAWSQPSDSHPVPRSEFSLYAGYSLLAPNLFNNYLSESGWNAGIDVGITRNAGAAVDFSQYFSNYGLGANTTPFFVMVGPRVWAPVGNAAKMRFFVDLLVGGGFIQTGRTTAPPIFASSTSFTWNTGGGVDIRAANHLWVRGEASFMHTQFKTWDTEVQQFAMPGHARIGIGILYRR